MTQFDKVLNKFLDDKSTVTFNELEYLLNKLGYIEKKTGKTSGPRKAYVNLMNKHIIRIHKPHPGNEVKAYVKKEILKMLKENGII